nr:hypothetical protein CFP56_60748 [Quercus suber]
MALDFDSHNAVAPQSKKVNTVQYLITVSLALNRFGYAEMKAICGRGLWHYCLPASTPSRRLRSPESMPPFCGRGANMMKSSFGPRLATFAKVAARQISSAMSRSDGAGMQDSAARQAAQKR